MHHDRSVDLLLLHPPSVYDFRERSILYGPISDMVPSSPVFEMYPVGFLTIASYLADHGLETRIVNLALRMMNDRRFDVRAFLARQRPRAVGIDLHWLPHAHGALEIARLVRETLPSVPVILGGLSATYFHRELIDSPCVDFVLRGDSTEPPLRQLLAALGDADAIAQIPNLTWKRGGEVQVNPLSFVPASLDYADVRPEMLLEMALRHRDLEGVLPFRHWLRNPITMVLPLKGCARDCATCGSSRTTCTHLTHRTQPVFRSPRSLVDNMCAIGRLTRAPIVIPGDLLQGGREYADAILALLRDERLPNEIMFEFFDPPPLDFLTTIDASLERWSFEISPESHDEAVRLAMDGKGAYATQDLDAFLTAALRTRCRRIDVFFMIGLPLQTRESVAASVDYCDRLLARTDRRLNCFISPMGPFLDPGSRIFEAPEQFGYRLFARTLEEHRRLLVQPSWEGILNYETRWMSRRDLVDATYDAAERLNASKLRHGRVTRARAATVAARIAAARQLRSRLDASRGGVVEADAHAALRGDITRFSMSTVCDKRELAWPSGFASFRPAGLMRALAASHRSIGG
jgi:B12-binding domain/radical SAM domain protein